MVLSLFAFFCLLASRAYRLYGGEARHADCSGSAQRKDHLLEKYGIEMK